MKKTKYNRRRAINCEIIEKSKSNPGYCKYMITIQELDGTIHKQPAYGKDMQDAISRLINIERTVRIEKQLYAKTAGRPNLLIDDFKRNVDQWKSKGGIAIFHTSTSNTIRQLQRLGY